jgi:hypothetical protein
MNQNNLTIKDLEFLSGLIVFEVRGTDTFIKGGF